MRKDIKLAIVIPVYNSSSILPVLMERMNQTLKEFTYTVIFVNDGSKDNSWETLLALKQSYPLQVTAINLSRNYGQHNAILCGLSYAKADVVVTMDDDLQHAPEDILKLLNRFNETNADIVYGEYTNRQHDMISSAGSYIMDKSNTVKFDKVGRGSSFRLLKQEIIDKIVLNHQHNFHFIDEVISWYTSTVEFVPIEHHKRFAGKSGYSKSKQFSMFLNTFVNYSAAPLKMMTYLGIAGSILTFLLGSFFIAKKIFFQISVPGFTALIVAVLFSTSIILLCFGIIGQYLYRILQIQHRKPPFSVKQII